MNIDIESQCMTIRIYKPQFLKIYDNYTISCGAIKVEKNQSELNFLINIQKNLYLKFS